jgi:hypothetical protein
LTTTSPSEPPPAPDANAALDFILFEEVARLAERAASYWQSIALAAERGEVRTVTVHCKQVADVTREAFAVVKTLGGYRDAAA